MQEIINKIYIGNSQDALYYKDIIKNDIVVEVNCALDLTLPQEYIDLPYIKSGIMEGGGNTVDRLYIAVNILKMLRDIFEEKDGILVFCHNGGRALSVVLYYMALIQNITIDEGIKILQEKGIDTNIINPELLLTYRKLDEKMRPEKQEKIINELLV